SKLGFEKLTESVLGKRGSSGKAFSHGNIFGRRVNRQVQSTPFCGRLSHHEKRGRHPPNVCRIILKQLTSEVV
ncbi:MAG: hypothetical protein D8B56_05165, partial [Alloprevotella sp.]